jgi:hypothetical protein
MLPGPPTLECSHPETITSLTSISHPGMHVSPCPPPFTGYPLESRLVSPYAPSLTNSSSRNSLRATTYENRGVRHTPLVIHGISPSQNHLSPVESAPTSWFSISFRLSPIESALTSMRGEGGTPTSVKYLPHSPALSFLRVSSQRSLGPLSVGVYPDPFGASNLHLVSLHPAEPLRFRETLLESPPRVGTLS